MAESVVRAETVLLDLSGASVADLPLIDDEVLQAAVGRLIGPCGGAGSVAGRDRVWQNYQTAL